MMKENGLTVTVSMQAFYVLVSLPPSMNDRTVSPVRKDRRDTTYSADCPFDAHCVGFNSLFCGSHIITAIM